MPGLPIPGVCTVKIPLLFIAALYTLSCASYQGVKVDADVPPARLNPLEGAIVINAEVPDWVDICLQQVPVKTNRYLCVPVGELRFAVEQHRKAKTRDWPQGKIRAQRY